MIDAAEYKARLDRVEQDSGQDDGHWNERFVELLHAEGLVLLPLPKWTQGVVVEPEWLQMAPLPAPKSVKPYWYPSLIAVYAGPAEVPALF